MNIVIDWGQLLWYEMHFIKNFNWYAEFRIIFSKGISVLASKLCAKCHNNRQKINGINWHSNKSKKKWREIITFCWGTQNGDKSSDFRSQFVFEIWDICRTQHFIRFKLTLSKITWQIKRDSHLEKFFSKKKSSVTFHMSNAKWFLASFVHESHLKTNHLRPK